MKRTEEQKRKLVRDHLVLVEEIKRDMRKVPDAPPAPDSDEDLPFGDPRTLTSEAQRRSR